MLLLTALSCSTGLVTDLDARLAPAVSTVIEVHFTLDQAAEVHLAYTFDDTEAETPSRFLGPGPQRLRILGVPSATEVTWQLVASDTDGIEASELATIRTGNLPARVPTITAITHQPAAVADTWLLAAALTPESEDARVILDRQGRVVWYHLPEPGLSAPWAQAVPGEGLLFNQFDGDFCEDVGEVWCLDLSGELRRSTRTTDGHHTFVQHDDGTLAWIAVDRRSVDGFDDPVCGDRILELAPGESEPREVYSTWDDLEPGPGITQHKPFYCDCLDWTHANMLSWEAEAGRYLFSLSALDTILEIDRDSGEQVRSIGRLDDSWSFADGEGRFNHQHGSHYTDDGTLLLTWSDELTGATQATEYALDPDAGALEVVWAYAPAEPLPALALGEAHRLDGGNTLVNFGSRGALHEVASDGTLLWEATLDVGYFLGRTVVIEDLYALEAAD